VSIVNYAGAVVIVDLGARVHPAMTPCTLTHREQLNPADNAPFGPGAGQDNPAYTEERRLAQPAKVALRSNSAGSRARRQDLLRGKIGSRRSPNGASAQRREQTFQPTVILTTDQPQTFQSALAASSPRRIAGLARSAAGCRAVKRPFRVRCGSGW